jgi:putative spermidine/putrescine transport system permease protein
MVDYLLPYMIIMLYAAMSSVDTNLGPAARTLGARPWRAFCRVFFPLSKAGLIAGSLFVFVVSLGFYITPAVLGSTTDVALATYIQQKVNLYEWGVASAMGIALLVITLILFAMSNRSMDVTTTMSVGGSQKGTSRTQEFRWTASNIGLAVWSGLSFAFLLLPLGVVVLASFTSQSYLSFPPKGYSLRWYREVFNNSTWFDAAWLSLKIALLTTLISTALGLAAALGLERSRLRGKSVIRTLIYTPLIVPVVLTGASLFGFESRLRINGSVLGYVGGHVIITLPVAMIVLTTAIQGTDRSNEIAASTLGARPWTAFWRITFPSVAPSVGAAALVCFLISWDEPVIALFLSGIDQTLPVKYLLFLQQQLVPTMAAVGTLLMAAVLVSFGVLITGAKWSVRARRKLAERREELVPRG